jgi:hypothetical protein
MSIRGVDLPALTGYRSIVLPDELLLTLRTGPSGERAGRCLGRDVRMWD